MYTRDGRAIPFLFTAVSVVGDTNLASVLGLLLIVLGAGHVLSRRLHLARLPLGAPFLVLVAVQCLGSRERLKRFAIVLTIFGFLVAFFVIGKI